MSGVVRRRVMNKPEEKGPIVNTYTRQYTITKGGQYYWPFNIVRGADYIISARSNFVRGYIRIGFRAIGNSGNKYTNPVVYTLSNAPSSSLNQIDCYIDNFQNSGTLTLTITETIPRT